MERIILSKVETPLFISSLFFGGYSVVLDVSSRKVGAELITLRMGVGLNDIERYVWNLFNAK